MAYKYEKVDQKLLVPQIEDQLMMYMHQEQMEKGDRLPSEHKLGELFGVGRSTIREAVKSLVSKGVLEVKRGSGTYVKNTEITIDDPLGFSQFEDKYRLAMELFDVRILLEPEVAATACQKASEEDKKHIKELCDEVEQLYLSGKNHIQKDMESMGYQELNKLMKEITKKMHAAAAELDFERAATLRDQMMELKTHLQELQDAGKDN